MAKKNFNRKQTGRQNYIKKTDNRPSYPFNIFLNFAQKAQLCEIKLKPPLLYVGVDRN